MNETSANVIDIFYSQNYLIVHSFTLLDCSYFNSMIYRDLKPDNIGFDVRVSLLIL